MKCNFTFFALLLGISGHTLGQCDLPVQQLGAVYRITEQRLATGQTGESQLRLWRRGGQVAYEFPGVGIAEIWSRAPTRGMYLARYFDEHSRAIEYQPGELHYAHPATAWQDKQQLVASAELASMTPVSSGGSGCQVRESYAGKPGARIVALTWLPRLRLPAYMKIATAGGVQEWQLLETVRSTGRIDEVFTSREHYAATDYADIGDNESDPFLMSMIRLGFIEHGSHGFYDEEGHALESASH